MDTFRQFEVVLEIERSGSISKAAASLKIAQPTLSKLLAKIENDIGTPLFDRSVSPIKLTKAGDAFINSGRKILDTRHALKKELDEIKADDNLELTVGVSPSRAPFIVPRVISAYKDSSCNSDFPKIFFKELQTSELNHELQIGSLDLIVSVDGEDTAEFSKIELFEEKVLLAYPSEATQKSSVDLLKENDFIAIGRQQLMSKTYQTLKQELDLREPRIKCQSIELAMSLVNSGVGVSLVPDYFLSSTAYKNARYIELPSELYEKYEKSLKRRICIFYRNKKFLNAVENQFIEICKSTFKNN